MGARPGDAGQDPDSGVWRKSPLPARRAGQTSERTRPKVAAFQRVRNTAVCTVTAQVFQH